METIIFKYYKDGVYQEELQFKRKVYLINGKEYINIEGEEKRELLRDKNGKGYVEIHFKTINNISGKAFLDRILGR